MSEAFDPRALLSALNAHGVEYVLIGGLAATIHGSPLRTSDADICPVRSAENAARLCSAFQALGARLRTVDGPVAFPCDPEALLGAETWTLTTEAGDLDVSWRPAGTSGYRDLARDAATYDIGDGVTVAVSSLLDVIRSKQAAGREKDLAALPTLRRLLEMSDG